MASLSGGLRKENFGIKTILLRLLLPLLLIPVVLTLTTFFLSNRIEGALSERSRILYSGPDDLRTFITQDNLFNFLQGDFEPQIYLGSSADVALEVDGAKAYMYFSPENISSIIAYERLSKLLLQYDEISAPSEAVAVYYEIAVQELEKAGEGDQHSLYHIMKLLLASITSLLAFAILVSSGTRIINEKISAFADRKKFILSQFISSVLFSFCTSALVVLSIFVSANYLIPPLLSDTMEDFVLFTGINIFHVLFISGFVLGVAADTLKICLNNLTGNGANGIRDSYYIPEIFIFSAIFLNLSAIWIRMPEWVNFVPILNLQGVIRDAIIYGLESGRLFLVIGINIIFSAMCMILSLKAAKSGQIFVKEKGAL